VEHVASCSLAALDSAVEVALTQRDGVFTSKVDAILGCAEKPPITRELTGAEAQIRAARPRIMRPAVEPRVPVEVLADAGDNFFDSSKRVADHRASDPRRHARAAFDGLERGVALPAGSDSQPP
jgi:hypothetical protein